jgi:hypothetical protein
LEDEHDTSLKKEDECEAEIQRTAAVPFLAHVPLSRLLSCPYYTQCIRHITGVC